MNRAETRVDRIVSELSDNTLDKAERIRLLKELVERGEELPDEILDVALRRLMERLSE